MSHFVCLFFSRQYTRPSSVRYKRDGVEHKLESTKKDTTHKYSTFHLMLRVHPYRVDDQVKTHEVVEILVVVAHHGAVVAGVVQRVVFLHHSVLILAPVDQRRHLRHLGDYVEDVFVRVFPVVLEYYIGVSMVEKRKENAKS